MHLLAGLVFVLAQQVAGSTANDTCHDPLPVVDLGYVMQQALAFDARTDAYTFQNIRYGKAPFGDLRFRAPQVPDANRSAIQTGAEGRTCPQGLPAWQALGGAVSGKWTDPGRNFSMDAWVDDFKTTEVKPRDVNSGPGGTTEDCLFLDVVVPKKILQSAYRKAAPIIVWLHGGGQVLGSKTRFPNPQYNPSGLVSRSGLNNDDIIYVGVNYRLGAFGWLSAQDIGDDGDANVGLLDQRLALQWIQKYIHNFGGDKDKVTVMGESAGAGSVLLHMLAYGNNTRPPFTRGILQSPFVQATATPLNDTFQNFLSLLNVSSLEQARKLEEKDLIAANMALIANAPTNSYMFGPTVDGSFFPEVPLKMLRQGNFDKSVDILSTHTSREGAYFFDPDVENEDQFRVWLSHSVAGLSQDAITYLASELYPPTYDGSHGYYSIEERQMSLWEEAYFDCLYVEVGDVMGGRSYAGEFAVSPGFHTQDLAYIFDFPDADVPFPRSKEEVQEAIISFAQTGVPKVADGSLYPRWGSKHLLVNITETGAYVTSENVNRTRCNWWAETIF